MRAILVSVDYADLLAVTLPHNRHHFADVMVVTAPRDAETIAVAEEHGAQVFATNAFWDGGADFNKWKALELGLDHFGREGWLCVMDADVLWPQGLLWRFGHDSQGPMAGVEHNGSYLSWTGGMLCAPLRRMCVDLEKELWKTKDGEVMGLPDESTWSRYPIHRNVNEWAGYSQIFHADDPALEKCANCELPKAFHGILSETGHTAGCGRFAWHQTDWRHAGGADSFFQGRWSRERKVRPPWECLHLGPAGENWCGRVSPRLDGTVPDAAGKRASRLRAVWESRRLVRGFGPERLPPKTLQTLDGGPIEGSDGSRAALGESAP